MSKKGATSIHLKAIKNNTEAHNERTTRQSMPHVDPTLSSLNESWVGKRVWETLPELKALVKEKTGRTMQEKCKPFVEGVIVTKPTTTMDDLKKFGEAVKENFGWEPIQIHMHHDEGHKDENDEWKENYHAHIIFEMINRETGRTFKYNHDDLSNLQTLLAESIGMERGERSGRRHAENIEYKEQQAKITARVQSGKTADMALGREGAAASILADSIVNSLNRMVEEPKEVDIALLRKVAKTLDIKPAMLVSNLLCGSEELERLDDAKVDKLVRKFKIDTEELDTRADKIEAIKGHIERAAADADEKRMDVKAFRPLVKVADAIDMEIAPVLVRRIEEVASELKTYPEISAHAVVDKLLPKIELLDDDRLDDLCKKISSTGVSPDNRVDRLEFIREELLYNAEKTDEYQVKPSSVRDISVALSAVGTSYEEMNKEPRVTREAVNDALIQVVDRMDLNDVMMICSGLDLQERQDFYPSDMKVCIRNVIMESTREAEKKGRDASSSDVVKYVAKVAEVDLSSLPKKEIPVCDRESFDKLWVASALLGNNPQKLMDQAIGEGLGKMEDITVQAGKAEERLDLAVKKTEEAEEKRSVIYEEIGDAVAGTLQSVGSSKADVMKLEIHDAIGAVLRKEKPCGRGLVVKVAEMGLEMGLRPSEKVAGKLVESLPTFDGVGLGKTRAIYHLPETMDAPAMGEAIMRQAKDCDDRGDCSRRNASVWSLNEGFSFKTLAPDFLKKVDELAAKVETEPNLMPRLERVASLFDVDDKAVVKAAMEIGRKSVEEGRKELQEALEVLDPDSTESLETKRLSDIVLLADNVIKNKVGKAGTVGKLRSENDALKRTLFDIAIKQVPAIKTLYDAGMKSIDRVVELMQDMKTKFEGTLSMDNLKINFTRPVEISRKEDDPNPYIDGRDMKTLWKMAIESNKEPKKNMGPKL